MNINSVNISGNLTRDPELRDAGGTPLARLRLANNERVKDKQTGEWRDKPNYFDVDVWGRPAEVCAQYLHKGSRVVISGRLQWREWETDGGKRSAVSIVASVVELPPRSDEGYDSGYRAPAQAAPAQAAPTGGRPMGDFADDDIPF